MPVKQAEELVHSALQKVLEVTLNPSNATDNLAYLEETATVCPPQSSGSKRERLRGSPVLPIHNALSCCNLFHACGSCRLRTSRQLENHYFDINVSIVSSQKRVLCILACSTLPDFITLKKYIRQCNPGVLKRGFNAC